MPGGPPVKLREISFIRPFGFRANHAISYQAPPAVAAMLSRLRSTSASATNPFAMRAPNSLIGPGEMYTRSVGLVQGTNGGLLSNHMSPIRSKLANVVLPHHRHHNHQLRARFPGDLMHGHHISSLSVLPLSRANSHPAPAYPTHNAIGETLPITPAYSLNRPQFSVFSLGPRVPQQVSSQLEPLRRSHQQQRLAGDAVPGTMWERGVRLLHADDAVEGEQQQQQQLDQATISQELIEQDPDIQLAALAMRSPSTASHPIETGEPEQEEIRYFEAQPEFAGQHMEQPGSSKMAKTHSLTMSSHRRSIVHSKGSQEHRLERIEQPSSGLPARQRDGLLCQSPSSTPANLVGVSNSNGTIATTQASSNQTSTTIKPMTSSTATVR